MNPFSSPVPPLASIQPDDEESPAWLDEPLFQENGSVPPLDSSFWESMWPTSSPQRLRPVQRRLAPNESKLATLWNNGISYSKPFVLLVGICLLWPLGAWSFMEFTHNTDSTFHPIPGSISADAQAAFAQAYPNDWSDSMHPMLMLVLDSTTKESLVDEHMLGYNATKHFCQGLQEIIHTTCWKTAWDQQCATEEWIKITSYFSFHETQLDYLAQSLTASRGTTMVVEIQYLLPSNTTHRHQRINQLMDVLTRYDNQQNHEYFNVSYTGLPWFQSDLMKATKADLAKMDAIVLPLALILVGMVLPQANAAFVWIIPFITMITTVSTWSIIMRFFAKSMQITQFTPSIMMSLTLGMGIDYTLFLLSRYLEVKNDKARAVRHMIQHAGRVVIMSGFTLICTFLGLTFLPLQMLKSVGIGAAISIGCALIVNLTLVPALLHTRLGDWIVQRKSDGEESVIRTSEQPIVPTTSVWYRLSTHLLHPYKSVIILLVLVQLIVPIARYAGDIKSSISFDLLLPSAAPSLQAFHTLSEKMGPGRMAPFRILFDGRDANISITSDLGFDIMHRVIDEFIAIDSVEDNGITHIATGYDEVQPMVDDLMDTLGLSARTKEQLKEQEEIGIICSNSVPLTTQYAGIAVLKNKDIPHSLYMSAKYCAQVRPFCPVEALHLLAFLDSKLTSQDGFVTQVNAILSVDPFSDQGVAWLTSARETLKRLEDGGALGGIKVYIQGSAAIAKDAVDAVLGAFPSVICVTLAVVFVLMACFFRSLVAPLRSIVSISLTLAFVFGLVALVYEHGILDWTGVRSWSSVSDEVSWMVPVMAFSIIVGLALDYDVFLVSRILEFRNDEGYGHKSSIVAGLHATGGIITAAGIIMAVAFGGLMLSSSPVLYQWSFMITTAVLLDTFVIRTMVVPIVIGWTGKLSWWPQCLAEVRYNMPGFEEEERIQLDGVDPDPLLVGSSNP
jgi:predicted RND superfamily exporter protein